MHGSAITTLRSVGRFTVAAFVALPREELCFEARLGGGARGGAGERPLQAVRAAARGNCVYVSHDLPPPALRVIERAGLEPRPASGGAIAVAPLVPGVCAGLRWMGGASISVPLVESAV